MAVKTWSTPAAAEERRPVPCTLCGGGVFYPHFTCIEERKDGKAGAPPAERGSFFYVRCARCGLVQINPQPSPAAVSARYGTGHGGDYLSYETANEGAFLRLQELALTDAGFFKLETELVHGIPGPAVLDIGCATGALLSLLKGRGWAATGVEISGPQAEYCRRRGLDVRSLPLEENNFPPASFDVVLASHLIEHLNNPGSFVREVRRILKPAGRFYVTTPNITGLQARIFGSRWRSAIFDHLYLFSVKTLRALLEDHYGSAMPLFSVETVRTWGGLASGAGPAVLKTILDRAAKSFGFGDVMIIRAAAL